MKKYYCDVCKKDITGERYQVVLKLVDNIVLETVDICVQDIEKIEKMLGIEQKEAPQK